MIGRRVLSALPLAYLVRPAEVKTLLTRVTGSEIRTTDAVIIGATGVYPLRSTVTTDTARRVRWVGPTAPRVGAGYATTGFDVWEKTP